MENKNKRGEIQACYLLTKKGKLSSTHLQSDPHPPSGRSQIPGAKPRQENRHISTLRKHLDLRTKELYWIIGKHSPLSLNNKLRIQKAILKPAWTYGIELWGCASPSDIAKIQRYQSKLLRLITNAPQFVTNQTLHQDLCIEAVRNVFRGKAAAHHKTLSEHPNPLIGPLTNQSNEV